MIEHLYLDEDGIMMARIPIRGRRREVVVCPRKLRGQIVEEKHKQAHLGVTKTTARISLDWYWPGQHADVRRHVERCLTCQRSNVSQSRTTGEKYHLYAGRPWQILAIDLCGPFPATPRGNTIVLVMTDHFTRWCDAIPLVDGRAETIAKL